MTHNYTVKVDKHSNINATETEMFTIETSVLLNLQEGEYNVTVWATNRCGDHSSPSVITLKG